MRSFQLKGSMLTLTVLQLMNNNIVQFTQQLEQTVNQSPNFFKNAPVVIDLKEMDDPESEIDFPEIIAQLRKHQMIPVGMRNAFNDHQKIAAKEAGIGILSDEKSASKKKEIKQYSSTLITQPVRSGQQVYANQSDLVILAPVGAGAEVLADGDIHVYGALRGRALAGVSGNKNARIYCRQLDPELISIAGHYKLNEDIQTPDNAQHIQIRLEEDKLQIESV